VLGNAIGNPSGVGGGNVDPPDELVDTAAHRFKGRICEDIVKYCTAFCASKLAGLTATLMSIPNVPTTLTVLGTTVTGP
jgi:hypothetical protein